MIKHFLIPFLIFSSCFGQESDLISSNVKIIFYAPSKTKIYAISDFKLIFESLTFNQKKPTVLYVHGFTENRHGFTTKRMVKAFKSNNNFNFLSIDWGYYSKNFYFASVLPKLFEIGLSIANFTKEFFDSGYPASQFHCVGHSLGSHLCGLIGRTLKESNLSYELNRVSGLDPAGPGFYDPETYKYFKHISASDAKFVDIIHTDSFYGTTVRTGTADFYPNGGIFMSGCAIVNEVKDPVSSVCSHIRSVEYFAESVENPLGFVAVAADSYRKFKSQIYDKNNVAYMGIACRSNANGVYYLQTNSQSPFGRGCEGRYYQIIQQSNSGILTAIDIGVKMLSSFAGG